MRCLHRDIHLKRDRLTASENLVLTYRKQSVSALTTSRFIDRWKVGTPDSGTTLPPSQGVRHPSGSNGEGERIYEGTGLRKRSFIPERIRVRAGPEIELAASVERIAAVGDRVADASQD